MRITHRTKPLYRQIIALVMGLGALMPLSSTATAATILPLDFVYGGSTTKDSSSGSVTNQVDAWVGKAGDGWLTAWANSGNAGNIPATSATVLATNPLTVGRGRLEFSVSKSGSNNDSRRVNRKYDVAVAGDDHIISFQFRLDTPVAGLTRFLILDSTAQTTTATDSSWAIFAEGPGTNNNTNFNWKIYNGASVLDTNITLVAGTIYNFSVHVTDDTYSVTINGQTFNSLAIRPGKSVGGHLNFSLNPLGFVGQTTTSTISLGSISVVAVPEPGTVALMGAGVLFLATRRFKKG